MCFWTRRGDTRTIGLYGQELINITAAIARMNLVLHGVSDFDIRSGNTLHDPALIERDRLKTFDVVLANPPYSIKKWNREAWQSDDWGRNFLGTPTQGRADYAFFQHILKSMDPKTGRCTILFPQGVVPSINWFSCRFWGSDLGARVWPMDAAAIVENTGNSWRERR